MPVASTAIEVEAAVTRRDRNASGENVVTSERKGSMGQPSAIGFATSLIALAVGACGGETRPNERASEAAAVVEPPAECRAAWASEAASDFVDLLRRATVPTSPVWIDYDGAETPFVLIAGETESGETCVGAWRGGEALAFAAVTESPKLLTPLYGYHFPYPGNGGPFDGLVAVSTQPDGVRAWLQEVGVETAIVMPVEIEGLPFEVSALQKVQIALHEGFHVDVQARRWLDSSSDWPAWDLQPDRASLERCYVGDPEVEATLVAERQALDLLIGALLDGDSAAACQAGEAFLERRSTRYRNLSDVGVSRHDGTITDCAEAEAIMELEEGTADYVSWPRLYDLGLASRDQLMGRYGANQNDVFYLTGAMQLHAVSLMQDGEMSETARRIADSESFEVGSPTAVFEAALEAYCSGIERE